MFRLKIEIVRSLGFFLSGTVLHGHSRPLANNTRNYELILTQLLYVPKHTPSHHNIIMTAPVVMGRQVMCTPKVTGLEFIIPCTAKVSYDHDDDSPHYSSLTKIGIAFYRLFVCFD